MKHKMSGKKISLPAVSTKEALNCLSFKLVSCSFKSMFVHRINRPASLDCKHNDLINMHSNLYSPTFAPNTHAGALHA